MSKEEDKTEDEKYVTVEKQVDHPMDEVFDIDPGGSVIEYQERIPAELVDHEGFDDKDKEIEEQFQEVFELALGAFENSTELNGDIDPKYRARNSEVAVQYLTAALNAANSKANLKMSKDKIEIAAKKAIGGGTTNIIMDRNDLLKLLEDEEEKDVTEEPIDSEYEEIKDDRLPND